MDLTPGEIKLMVEIGLLVPTRCTPGGRVIEYRLTDTARQLLGEVNAPPGKKPLKP